MYQSTSGDSQIFWKLLIVYLQVAKFLTRDREDLMFYNESNWYYEVKVKSKNLYLKNMQNYCTIV